MKQKFFTEKDVMIFRPAWNSSGRRDVTGAFEPGVLLFCEHYDLDPEKVTHVINNRRRPAKMAKEVLQHIKLRKPTIYAFFCHGYNYRIQFGIRSPTPGRIFSPQHKKVWETFCDLIARVINPQVLLYACSTGDDPDGDEDTAPGSGDDSFGDLLRDELCHRGATCCSVFTHTTAGHSWRNPNIKILNGDGNPYGGIGGKFIADPGTKAYRQLNKLLKKKGSTLAWELPFMTQNSINVLLGA